MAVASAIVSGYLPTADSSSTDFTSSGFGTPDAAIVIVNNVDASNNPNPDSAFGFGYWAGTTEACMGSNCGDNAATTDTATAILSGRCVSVPISNSAGYELLATGSSITDGLRVTKDGGSTSVSRYCTVVLLKGLTNEYAGIASLPSTGTSLSVTAPGFKPDLLLGSGAFQSAAGLSAQARISLGASHNNSADTITQGCVAFGDLDNQSTSNVNTTVRNDRWIQQAINGSNAAYASVSSHDASVFSLSDASSCYVRQYIYLALELPDPDDAYVGVVDSKTSTGTQAYTGTGFEPNVLALIGTTLTTVNTLATSSVGSVSVGVANATAERSMIFGSQDAVATTNTYSRIDASNVVNLRFHDDSVDAVADLDSFDSNGWTLNYSDGSASARKMLAFAIGDSTAGGGAPTLSDLQAVSITSTTVQGTYDYAF